MGREFNNNKTKKIDINKILQKFIYRQNKENYFFIIYSILKCKNNNIQIH